jgi:hypothetical protein
MAPLDEFMDNPLGSPDAPKVLGPFEAVTVNENADPSVPETLPELVIDGGEQGAVIVNVTFFVPVPHAFVALNVTEYDPAEAGKPEMNPVDVLIESPPGRPVAP